MNRRRDKLSINVAKLYYRSDYSQQKIAEELGISRPSVSRLLQYAKDKGYVKIQIFDPVEDMSHMEEQLIEKYHLKDVRIAASTINDSEEIKKYIGIKAAEYLNTIINDGDIIGVGWGTTLYSMACSLIPKELKGAQIVQLEGGVTHTNWKSYAREIMDKFSANYNTIAQYLPLPMLLDSKEIKEIVYQDRHIKHILELGEHANIAVFSIGNVLNDALFFRIGYISDDERARIQRHAVGDICSHFFDYNGNLCNSDIDDRTVGIKLDCLKDKEYSILVSGGENKLEALRAALAGRYANVLITDQFTARTLLADK